MSVGINSADSVRRPVVSANRATFADRNRREGGVLHTNSARRQTEFGGCGADSGTVEPKPGDFDQKVKIGTGSAEPKSKAMEFVTQKMGDAEYLASLKVFYDAAQLYADTLGLDKPELTELQAQIGQFEKQLQETQAAKNALKATVTEKDAQRDVVRDLVGTFARRWRADENIPNEILAGLRLAPHRSLPVRSAPAPVTDLVITANGEGELSLRWNRNGNVKGTLFMVETAPNGSGPWVLLDSVTSTKFSILGEPGVPIWFRVRTKRRGLTSVACLPVSIWAGGVGSGLLLAG